MLYDELTPFEEAPTCPNEDCKAGMKLLRNSRFENLKQERLRYECPHCHYRMTITTRNNLRIDMAIAIGFLSVLIAFALGVLYEYGFLFATKAIVHA